MKQPRSVKDISKMAGQPLAHIDPVDQIPLPPPFDDVDLDPPIKPLTDAAREKYYVLDDTIAVNIVKPESKEEEERLVQSFLTGLEKLFKDAFDKVKYTLFARDVRITEIVTPEFEVRPASLNYSIASGEEPPGFQSAMKAAETSFCASGNGRARQRATARNHSHTSSQSHTNRRAECDA